MSAADRERWNEKYRGRGCDTLDAGLPPEWVRDALEKLPPGRALDVACGRGELAIWLARRGWQVVGIDISDVGLMQAQMRAAEAGVSVEWRQADLDECALETATYDLITLFRYLDRAHLPPRLMQALRPGGHLIAETFSRTLMDGADARPCRPEFVLEIGEFPIIFHKLRVVFSEIVNMDGRGLARFMGEQAPTLSDTTLTGL